jgi:hypothetical protein
MKKLLFIIIFMLSATLSAQEKESTTVSTKATVEKSDNQILKEDKKQKVRADIRNRRAERKGEMRKARKSVEKRVKREERKTLQ